MIKHVALVLLIFTNAARADEINQRYDSAVVGDVNNISSYSFEFTPSDIYTFNSSENFYLNNVAYDDAEVENFQKLDDSGTIYLTNGAVIRASKIVVNQKNIEFIDEKDRKQLYGIDMVSKIVYSNGTIADSEILRKDEKPAAFRRRLFLELELGWNGYVGIGGRVDYRIFKHVSINGGAGLGYWGPRLSGALRFYLKYPYGGVFSIGAAHNLGDKSQKIEDGTGDYDDKEMVDYRLKPVTTINATWLYAWRAGNRNKFYIETGFAYAIQKDKYSYTTESGKSLSRTSEFFKWVESPGGLILTVGYSFFIF